MTDILEIIEQFSMQLQMYYNSTPISITVDEQLFSKVISEFNEYSTFLVSKGKKDDHELTGITISGVRVLKEIK